ncbi:hypothetical protein MLD38_008813 [Melastoma candidum]|uniref:Uncharacterized protein n=1 Tax=Melastoma candidum TaxID=119954 RepID=A0ACB9RVI1_9MYRT|nr:hypothetical protein MLD38_008813 [Melastoma candidum]
MERTEYDAKWLSENPRGLKELCDSPSKNSHDETTVKQAHPLQEPGSEQDDKQFTTPAQKSYSHEDNAASPGSTETSISSGRDGFTKNGTDSSSLSSDPETDPFDHSIGNPLSINGLGQQGIRDEFPAETPVLETGFDIAMNMDKYRTYKELADRARNYEEELMLVRRKLKFSGEENSRLKSELEKHETSARGLQLQLEAANVQLQNQISDSRQENAMLKQELEQIKAELDKSNVDKAETTLKYDMERNRVLELEKRVLGHESDISELHLVVSDLRAEISEVQEKYLFEKDQLQSDITGHLERQKVLMATITEGECKGKLLQENLSRCESEKADLEKLIDASKRDKLRITEEFCMAILEKDQQVEELNKDFDKLKLKYDMLMAEKDELNAQIQNLLAQLSSRDDRIRQVEEDLCRSMEEREELMTASLSRQNIVDELRFRVAELEREVGQQKTALLDGAEKKREAIRQLCFSLDHYRTEYQELHQACCGRRQNLMVT